MKELKNSLDFIKQSKKQIYIISVIFLSFIFIGFLFPVLEEELLKIISEMQKLFEGLNLWQTILLIFINNSRACLIAIISGISLGIIPIIITLSNGYLIGFVSNIVTKKSSFLELWRLFPHGIFEIPAVLISLGIGLFLGVDLIKNKKDFLSNFEKSLKTFVLIILPLLTLAAIIEGILIFCFN